MKKEVYISNDYSSGNHAYRETRVWKVITRIIERQTRTIKDIAIKKEYEEIVVAGFDK